MPRSNPRFAILADPDPVTRQVCHAALAAAGFAVVETPESGASAVAMARAQQPDLIVLGQQLLDVSAAETVTWLRSNGALRTTPVVILGGKPYLAENRLLDPSVVALPRPITASRIRRTLVALCCASGHPPTV